MFFWLRLRSYLPWLLLPPTLTLVVALLQHPPTQATPLYRSSAKILISPGSRGSDLQFNSLTDPRTIQELLGSQEFLERVVARAGLRLSWLDLRGWLQTRTTGHLQEKVDLIELVLTGPDGDRLGRLNSSLVTCLVESMKALAVAEPEKTLSVLERERGRAQKQVAQAWQKFRRYGARVDRLDPLRMAQLRAARSQLEREIVDLDLQTPTLTDEGPIATETERGTLALAALREVYLDRSPLVQAQRARLQRLSRLRQQARTRRTRMARLRKEAGLAHLRQRLHRVNQELRSLEERQPDLQSVLRSSALERELSMWQDNLDDLTRQRMDARLLREQRASSLTLVVVEKPQKGQLVVMPSMRLEALRLWLRRLPESFLVGVLVAFGIHLLRKPSRLESDIEAALGLPILGCIPRPPVDLCRSVLAGLKWGPGRSLGGTATSVDLWPNWGQCSGLL